MYFRPSPQDVVQFQSATHWGFYVAKEDQRHAIAGRQSNELIAGLSPRVFLCFTDSFLQMKEHLLLLIHRKAGVSHDVHEQDVRHLQRGVRTGI
jgi:hypothetical protein